MNNARYLAIMLGVAGLIAGSVAGFNYAVDPLGIYRPGSADRYPAAVNFSRLKKAEDIKRLKPDAVITGTSRAENGLDPRDEFFPGLTAYNLAMASATMREQRAAFAFAQNVRPLKAAVITLDFFAFNARKLDNKQFDPARLAPAALSFPRAFLDTWGQILSVDMLTAAVKDRRYRKRPARYAALLPNGRKTNEDVQQMLRREGARVAFLKPPNAAEISVDDFSFAYSDAPGDTTFRHLEAMLDLAREKGTRVILVISPVHVLHLDAIENAGRGADEKAWKERLKQIARANGEKYGAEPYPLWDFSTRNDITTEAPPAPGDKTTEMKWFWDSNHYKAETGDLILRKVLGLKGGEAHPGFGRRL